MRRRRVYASEFRRKMVDLVQAGRTPEELSREFEPSAQTIRNWVAESTRKAGRGDGVAEQEREELNRLRRENEQLRIELDILGRAADWLARETDVPSKKSKPS